MTGYELALHSDAEPKANWFLKVGRDMSGRLITGPEPWFEIRLFREEKLISGGVAQPFTCFQGIASGRKAAMLGAAGILALALSNGEFTVDLHASDGRLIRCTAGGSAFQALIERLSLVTH